MVKNKTRNTILAKNQEFKNSLLQKSIGLIGKKEPSAIIIKTRFGIHTWGISFPIDVLILNKDFRVVKIKENLKQGRIFFWNPKHKIVIELPKGEIKKSNTQYNDEFKIS